MSANTSVYSAYPVMQVQPQMGMYPPIMPSGFTSPDMQGEAVVVNNYNP